MPEPTPPNDQPADRAAARAGPTPADVGARRAEPPLAPLPPRAFPPASGSACRPLIILLIIAALAQGLAMLAIQHQRGDVTAYAFQSPDAAEYVALARGLAWHSAYVPVDSAGVQLGAPDTWRTPGYPLFLALIVRVAGDSPLILLIAQQVVAIATIPLLWLVLNRLTRRPWAFLGTLIWCLDPFRLYYGLWLMSETLFTCVLLLAAWIWIKSRTEPHAGTLPGLRTESRAGHQSRTRLRLESQAGRRSESLPPLTRGGQGGVHACGGSQSAESNRPLKAEISNAFLLGVLSALLVLIRPIAAPLPLLALIGVTVFAARKRHPNLSIRTPQSAIRNAAISSLACLIGIALPLGPWLARNRILTGHYALSCQSGASLAYHKVVDVVLWSEGRSAYRFNPAATTEIRERIDQRLRREWADAHPTATPEQIATLTWQNLNFGKPVAVDAFEASSALWAIGLDMLADRIWPMIKCFAFQGAGILIFPLGLVLWPPAGTGSAPFSMLFGSQGSAVARILPPAIGAAYATLAIWVLIRLVWAVIRRRWSAGLFAFWPAALMFAFSLPSEDPRFRLPLTPLLIMIAVAQDRFAFPRASRSNPSS